MRDHRIIERKTEWLKRKHDGLEHACYEAEKGLLLTLCGREPPFTLGNGVRCDACKRLLVDP